MGGSSCLFLLYSFDILAYKFNLSDSFLIIETLMAIFFNLGIFNFLQLFVVYHI